MSPLADSPQAGKRCAAEFQIGLVPPHCGSRFLDGGLGFRQRGLLLLHRSRQFRRLDHGQRLPLADAVAEVRLKGLQITRDLRVNRNLLLGDDGAG